MVRRIGASRPESLWRHRNFRLLWIGQTISEAGSGVSYLAIPLVAVISLHAGAFAVGLLGTLQFLPFLLVGLPAGVWVDRLPRRAVMVVADAGRMLALGSIPVVAVLGHLTLVQLYAVGFGTGVLTVFFDVAYQSFLPALVPRERLAEGNSRLEFTRATTEVISPGVGGVLVRAMGPPIAVSIDAVSYLASVVFLLRVRMPREARHAPVGRSMLRELREGVSYVVRQPLLRAVAISIAVFNVAANAVNAILILYAVRDLGLSPAVIGFWFSVGSITSPAGAALASRLARRVGTGPAIIVLACMEAVAYLPIALAPRAFPLPLLICSGLLGGPGGVGYNVLQVSLRQSITPPRLLGRMNATMRFFVWGTIPLGAFVGGLTGSAIGLHNTIWLFAIAAVFTPLPLLLSAVRTLRDVGPLTPPSEPDLLLEAAR